MRRRLACLLFLAAGGLAQGVLAQTSGAASQAARNDAGRIEIVEGTVSLTGANGTRRAVRAGETLFEGDAITTGSDGELHAELVDGGVIAVRPNTLLRIMRYKAEGGATDASVFNLVKGSFRSITGWIAQRNPVNYRIQTPTATVGVRGTDHEPLVIPEGASEGEPGTYDRVHAGATRVQGKSGVVDVTAGRTGFFSGRAGARPRLLDRTPAFFRAGRQDRRLEGRHEKVRQVLETRRVERRQQIEQRRREREAGLMREREARRTEQSRRQAERVEQRKTERTERRKTEQAERRESRRTDNRNERDSPSVERNWPQSPPREAQRPANEGRGSAVTRDPPRERRSQGQAEQRREAHGRQERH